MDSLICVVCGADLGDADDPYRDPDCMECLNRSYAAEEAAYAERERARMAGEIYEVDTTDCPF